MPQTTRPSFLSLLPLLLLLLLLASPVAHAQAEDAPPASSTSPSPSPTPAPTLVGNRTLSDVTPNRDTLVAVLGTDAAVEVENDADVANVASFEWALRENDTSTTLAPFLVCATGGRAGVESLLAEVPRAQVVPLVNDGKRTCFVFHETAEKVLNLTTTQPELAFATPLPSICKAAKGLFQKIHTYAFLESVPTCTQGIRVVMAPGFGQRKDKLDALRGRVKRDFATKAYRRALATGFYWLAANSTLLEDEAGEEGRKEGMVGGEGKALQHRQKKQKQKVLHVSTPSKPSTTPPPTPFTTVRFEDDELVRATGPNHHLNHHHRHLQDLEGGGGGLFNPFPTPTASPSAAPTPSPTSPPPPALTVRGQRWQERIQAALSGDFRCTFASLRIQVDMPYVSLTAICGLNNGTTPQSLDQGSSCLLALLAYLTTLPEVMYIEPYPVLKTFNWDAAGIGQSGDATSTPAWGVGLTGQGQVVGVADTGLDVNNCFF